MCYSLTGRIVFFISVVSYNRWYLKFSENKSEIESFDIHFDKVTALD